MNPLQPSAKFGLVLLGLIGALVAAWLAVVINQYFAGPDAVASSGMHAFGDLVLGVGVFGLLALGPIGLGLYWLRAVEKFWPVFASSTLGYALTGWAAFAVILWVPAPTSYWIYPVYVRFGTMPLSGLVFLVCAVFSPQARPRWCLAGAAVSDAAVFTGLVAGHFLLHA